MIVGKYSFKNKAEAQRIADSILKAKPAGSRLEKHEEDFVLAFLHLRNPDVIKDKLGNGPEPKIRHISRMYDKGHTVFCFHRSDGTITDFSVKKALYPESHECKVKRAARWEVREHTEWYKKAYFTGKCEITGQDIDISSCHVDHVPPQTFDTLFADFLRSQRMSIKSVDVKSVGDFKMGTEFADRLLAAKWYSYHLENCLLRITSPKANLTLVPKMRGHYS